jgi:cytoskeleton protein RodZ
MALKSDATAPRKLKIYVLGASVREVFTIFVHAVCYRCLLSDVHCCVESKAMATDILDHTPSRAAPHLFAKAPRQKPDGQTDPAGEVGWFLQREREKRVLTLEQASEATGIHPYHLEAIECGDMTHMPPRMEALEMIAVYAQLLGFDPDPLVQHLVTFMPAPPVARRTFHPANPPVLSSAKVLRFGQMPRIPSLNLKISNFPGGPGGMIASAFAVFMLFSATNWMMSSAPEQIGAAVEQTALVTPAVPTEDTMPTASTGPEAAQVHVAQDPISGPPAVANADDVPPIPQPDAAIASEDPDAMGAFIQEQVPAPKAKGKAKMQDQIASAAATDGTVYGADNSDARLVLKAKSAVWLRIEDAKGNVLITQMMAAGDTYRVPNKDGLIALSRDGGKLSYLIDGKEVGVLGPPGKILVGEKLDIESLAAKQKG